MSLMSLHYEGGISAQLICLDKYGQCSAMSSDALQSLLYVVFCFLVTVVAVWFSGF